MSTSHQISGSPECPRQKLAEANRVRALQRSYVTWLIVCVCGLILPACRGSQVPPNSNAGPADNRRSTFTTPPFSTKEPNRYQAIRITSFTETGSTENAASSQSTQVSISRDGEKRREAYSGGASGEIVYLEIPAGRFIVLPESRIYADLSSTSGETGSVGSSNTSPELSADQLLNEPHAPATYEKLGTETLAGRMTTKYRVVVVLTGVDSPSETLIWIDEGLGIPVRSETVSKSNGHSSKVTMELKDITLEVDEGSFSWPSDYRKVEAGVIHDLIRKGVKPTTPKQEGK